jgi:hypothetical protein
MSQLGLPLLRLNGLLLLLLARRLARAQAGSSNNISSIRLDGSSSSHNCQAGSRSRRLQQEVQLTNS